MMKLRLYDAGTMCCWKFNASIVRHAWVVEDHHIGDQRVAGRHTVHLQEVEDRHTVDQLGLYQPRLSLAVMHIRSEYGARAEGGGKGIPAPSLVIDPKRCTISSGRNVGPDKSARTSPIPLSSPSKDRAGGRFPMNHASGLATPDRSSWSLCTGAGGSGAGAGGNGVLSSRRGIGGNGGGRGDLSLSLGGGPLYLGPRSRSGSGNRRGGGEAAR